MAEHPFAISSWAVSTHLSRCGSFSWHCPACGVPQCRQVPAGAPLDSPEIGVVKCDHCGTPGVITLLGRHPSVGLQRSWDLPTAQRTPVSAQPPSRAASDHQDDPDDEQRLSVRDWRQAADEALRRRLRNVWATEIAEAHRSRGLRFTYQPARKGCPAHDSRRIYSRGELVAALDLIEHQRRQRSLTEVRRG